VVTKAPKRGGGVGNARSEPPRQRRGLHPCGQDDPGAIGFPRQLRPHGRGAGWERTITPDLVEFIAERDSFYLGTASADGQPYIQRRGGKRGFLKVLDEHTLAFADFSGNRQYISMGNLSENDRAFIFLVASS
jgi:hypothetical protein